MKKLTCMVLLFSVLFTVTACGDSREEQNSDKELEIIGGLSEEVKEPETETGTAVNSEVQTEIQLAETAGENAQQEETEMKMKVQVGDTIFTATLAENSYVDAL